MSKARGSAGSSLNRALEATEERRTELSIESVSPQMQLNRTCQREVHLAVLLVSSRPRRLDFTRGGKRSEGYAITANFARKRDLRGKEKGIYFPLRVYISLAVKTNITVSG